MPQAVGRLRRDRSAGPAGPGQRALSIHLGAEPKYPCLRPIKVRSPLSRVFRNYSHRLSPPGSARGDARGRCGCHSRLGGLARQGSWPFPSIRGRETAHLPSRRCLHFRITQGAFCVGWRASVTLVPPAVANKLRPEVRRARLNSSSAVFARPFREPITSHSFRARYMLLDFGETQMILSY